MPRAGGYSILLLNLLSVLPSSEYIKLDGFYILQIVYCLLPLNLRMMRVSRREL